jgi:hypothetical protein
MNDEADFIQTGLENYVEALQTLEHFSARIQARALAYGQARTEWDGFTPARFAPHASRLRGGASPWLSVSAEGSLSDGSTGGLDFGIWWLEPRQATAYAGFWKGPDWAKNALLPGASTVELVSGNPSKYFGHLIRGSELEASWGAVLDELLAAVRRHVQTA